MSMVIKIGILQSRKTVDCRYVLRFCETRRGVARNVGAQVSHNNTASIYMKPAGGTGFILNARHKPEYHKSYRNNQQDVTV
jgi:hypothetical protein